MKISDEQIDNIIRQCAKYSTSDVTMFSVSQVWAIAKELQELRSHKKLVRIGDELKFGSNGWKPLYVADATPQTVADASNWVKVKDEK